MCGIAGIIGRADGAAIARMVDVQAHRGPDDHGVLCDQARQVALGHRRLSILDLSPAGHQPMASASGRLSIVFNGEIFNFRELRSWLEGRGYVFRSRSDTEVILALYEEVGVEAFARLNGMFALAIWDRERDEVVLARDHFGIKPLYYAVRDGVLAFASEAKALFEVPGFEPKLNEQALPFYLRFLWTPDPLTMFEGVLKLPAAHYAIWRGGNLSLHRFWDLQFPEAGRTGRSDERALVREFRDRFTAAVESQLVSDVPLGAFLSAGLDSSAIVAAMASRASGPVRTYTIGFAPRHRAGELTVDDPDVAARTAAHFGCVHTPITVDPDVAALLPRLVWHMDEPTSDPALIMAYLVSREARRDVTVLLSGVGGDELLGGYRKYIAAQDALRYAAIPGPLRRHVLDPLFRHAPATPGRPWSGLGRLLRKWGRSASLPPRAQFIANATYIDPAEQGQLLLAEPARRLAGVNTSRYHEAAFDRVAHADWLHQMLYNDSTLFMTSLNLTYNDKMSMASSVEARVPFLDWELAQWVATEVPAHAKLRGRTTKWLLREAFRDVWPAEVLTQRKAGFGAPIGVWLRNDLRPMVDDLLTTAQVRRRGLFDPDAVRRVVEAQRAGQVESSMQVWQLLTLELWMQTFLDGRRGPVQ
jgi:asparagine synthase (glutamine-hydrolysing)